MPAEVWPRLSQSGPPKAGLKAGKTEPYYSEDRAERDHCNIAASVLASEIWEFERAPNFLAAGLTKNNRWLPPSTCDSLTRQRAKCNEPLPLTRAKAKCARCEAATKGPRWPRRRSQGGRMSGSGMPCEGLLRPRHKRREVLAGRPAGGSPRPWVGR